jgi:hypothetical protein
MSNEWIQVVGLVIQTASLIGLFIYVKKTWEMTSATIKVANASEISIEQETAPYIVIYFDVPFGSDYIYLVVKNIGHSIASQVKFTISPSLKSSLGLQIAGLSFIKDGIPLMPPNHEIRTLFDRMSVPLNKDFPMQYNVNITYYGGTHMNQRVVEQILDLSPINGLAYVAPKDMKELIKQVEKIVTITNKMQIAMDKISASLQNGIINNSSLYVTQLNPNVNYWKQITLAKLREFENLWLLLYGEEPDSELTIERLQIQALFISNQLLTLHANSPEDTESDLLDNIIAIAKQLQELGKQEFYFYAGGEIILESFMELGSAIVKKINDIKNSGVDITPTPQD